ncbi:MAG: hypothetical protein HY713_13505 [candidate division NC10 bacterium]|nr:hypothetical protein [candidate division NC10 bacterium]
MVSDLKQALRLAGCPLCRLLRNADLHYLRVFLREGKDDGRMLLRLLGSWGLCAPHAGALVRIEPVDRGDGLGTGTLYDWLLDQARGRLVDLRRDLGADGLAGSPLRANRRNSGKRLHKLISRLARKTVCPACESHRQYVPYVTEAFVRALEPAAGLPEIREMYLASHGLCLVHWRGVLELRPSSGVRELVTARQHEVVASLKAALDAALERGAEDEVCQGGREQTPAYARALAAVAGDTAWQPDER